MCTKCAWLLNVGVLKKAPVSFRFLFSSVAYVNGNSSDPRIKAMLQ